MKLINYSAEPQNKLYGWLPHTLKAEQIIFFPDACPGRAPLPTGTVCLTKQKDWRRFAISDCGCGMLLLRSNIFVKDFSKDAWNDVYHALKANKGKLGDLGSGNHFIDALKSYNNDTLYFLIHTGSRNESKSIEPLIDKPVEFDRTFTDVCNWAFYNRAEIAKILTKSFGDLLTILDANHNHFEKTDNGIIIRKGAVRVKPNDLAVIPSNINGDIVLVKATDKVNNTLYSLNHGTGRVMSRSQAKSHVKDFDFEKLREQVYIPEMIKNVSIKTEAPFCYRPLDDCLNLISSLIVEINRFSVIAYLGQI